MKSLKTAGNNDFSDLIVFCGYKRIVFLDLAIHVITWLTKVLGDKYRLIPARAEDGRNRKNRWQQRFLSFNRLLWL